MLPLQAELIPRSVGDWSDVLVIVGSTFSALWWLDYRLRRGPLSAIRQDLELHAKRDCVHHALLFERAGITDGEVLERERLAGVEPKPVR